MQTLRINVASLLRETAGGAREHPVAASAESVAAMVPEVLARSPLTGTARLLRGPRSIFARVRASAEVALECSRCLEEAGITLDMLFDAEYFPTIDVATGSSLAVPDDEMSFAIDRNHELDLAEAVRQELLVALPMHPLCSPGCAGLCARCGHNLNLGPCGCDPEQDGGRLASLQVLLDDASTKRQPRRGG